MMLQKLTIVCLLKHQTEKMQRLHLTVQIIVLANLYFNWNILDNVQSSTDSGFPTLNDDSFATADDAVSTHIFLHISGD